ncbi:MAG: DUF6320 domain-containing protein [Christensenellales bacterium]|jgi:hypothetical protein
MSYCVECGVQLAQELEKCPLCQTPVINPNAPKQKQAEPAYPDQIEAAIDQIDRGYARQLSVIIMMVPILIVLLLDIIDGGSMWSPYVIGALVMLWCFLVVPIVFRLRRPYIYVTLDVLALCGYLALIAWMSGNFSWYSIIALPLLVLMGVTILLVLLIIRRIEMVKLHRGALLLLLFGAFLVALEVILDRSIWGAVRLSWSVYAATPMMVIALMAYLLEHNKVLKEEIRKRLFL